MKKGGNGWFSLFCSGCIFFIDGKKKGIFCLHEHLVKSEGKDIVGGEKERFVR